MTVESVRFPDRPDLSCDLVMKGGITSGAVYPGAVLKLQEHYRFESIGGASAGAIAAAVTAAAEFGRRQNRKDGGGFERFSTLAEQLGESGFLRRLFAPRHVFRRQFEVLLAVATRKSPPVVVGQIVMLALTRLKTWLMVLPAVVIGAAALGADHSAAAILLALLVLGGGALAAIVLAICFEARRLWTQLGSSNGFGLCDGIALSQWVSDNIQGCAGLKSGRLLTFADLKRAHVELELVSTDLSLGRPITLQLDGSVSYYFRFDELRGVLPEAVVRQLAESGTPSPLDETLTSVSALEMPIVMAARMSLSFPVLLAAVPLHTIDAGLVLDNYLSDGGISSNFPIHFFDAWLPGHPTFGLDLDKARRGPGPGVFMSPNGVSPRHTSIGGLTGFLGQILDSTMNWRDTLQSELPGFRGRVCHVYIPDHLGGLNLDMTPAQLGSLDTLGAQAGELIHATFDFDGHRMQRYELWMQQMQLNLARAEPPFDHFSQQIPDAARAVETGKLIDLGASWGHGGRPSFNPSSLPRPIPTMRVVPRV